MIDTSIPARSTMRLLRSDLIVTPTRNPPGCSVRDERSGEVYEFGAVENFLISRLRRPYRTDDLSKECNARFDLNYRSQDIEQFIEMLAGWQLLRDQTNGARPAEGAPVNVADEEEELESQASAVEFTNYVREPNTWHFFNPQALLDGLLFIVYPFRFLLWLVPVVFALGALSLMYHWRDFVADLPRLFDYLGILARMVIPIFTLWLLDQIARGLVARHFGLPTPSFGVSFGFERPRFHIQVVTSSILPRHERLWLSGLPILLRFFIFGTTAIAWTIFRPSGSELATIAFEFLLISIIMIVILSNPLWMGDGPRFLAALLDNPSIQKAPWNHLRSFFVKQPAVIARYKKYGLLLGLFGLCSTAFVVFYLSIIISQLFLYLEGEFRGAGVALFILICIYVAWRANRMIRGRKLLQQHYSKQSMTGFTGLSQPSFPKRGSAVGRPKTAVTKPPTDGKPQRWQRWLKYGLLLIFLACLFLPYTYHPGGEAEVFPAAKATLPAEMDGVVDRVFFKGGEWIEAGTMLGKLADYRQVKDLGATEASLEAKKFEIEQLKTTPSAEQIEAGEAGVESAKLTWKYAAEELARQKPLFDAGGLSVQDYEDLKEDAENKRGKLIEAQADLAALKALVNPNKIESLKAEADMLKDEIVFYKEQLRRTSIISPISGEITTKNLDYLPGAYLKHGTTFAEVENIRTVRIEIAVPESDIGEVKIGAKVSVRLWAYPNREFVGEVSGIQPAAEETTAGKMVTVTIRMDNPEGILRSGLTGHVKISGEETIVAVAFTKALVRFVRVELWSWIP
jgi:putative peptide zinc metalloprotease protein